jgi:hypothetical protein
MARRFVPSLGPAPSPLISPLSFSAATRARLSAAISRPIRANSCRSTARRYCRPDHKCTARSNPTPAAHKCSLLIVLVMFMVRSMFATAHPPTEADLTVFALFYAGAPKQRESIESTSNPIQRTTPNRFCGIIRFAPKPKPARTLAQVRRPKSETRRKSEGRNPKRLRAARLPTQCGA